mmetsp:Transcript_23257/g.69658  ORF Transcript_23257/g.69658 Transcript_23257/m.69658 type:complete len:103 (+) Transcript_23257:250-558(+)|eukprot:CAMPEP_0119272814 /NCGR_PEP_ID=MMETSP1329-20130426/9096_1 /TAXON_ID=114041 /ORGANISM="Genus nov. species nov., Strain RCC1024" /LENGTH=102 /DNA_ID=CAMNT_0007272923 /DNA_START=233 /DNA_END=541 /DNA_ORIENTATION=+
MLRGFLLAAMLATGAAFNFGGGPKTPLSANGRKIEVPAGSSMMAACKKLGLNVPTNCRKGDCGTCTVNVGGKAIKACVGKVPPAPKLKSVLEKGLPVAARGR